MDDVAAAAGVSRGTVSRALKDGKKVSPAAMRAIHAAIEQTGYVVNRHARSLASQRSQSVALVLCDPPARLGEDPSFNILLFGCTEALSAYGITVALVIASGPADRRRAREHVTGAGVDGALVVSADPDKSIAAELAAAGVPTVAFGAVPHLSYVRTDDREGARRMVRYLGDTGRRTIATISGPRTTACGMERLAGWREVLGDRASDRLVESGDYTRASGHAAMLRLLERAPELDAVFVASDLMAAGALAALRHAGRRVPDDVAVGGFEDSAVAITVHPALTTVRRPLARISAELVRLLLAQLDGAPPTVVTLPTDLVVRESA